MKLGFRSGSTVQKKAAFIAREILERRSRRRSTPSKREQDGPVGSVDELRDAIQVAVAAPRHAVALQQLRNKQERRWLVLWLFNG